ncbi:MAG TPA: alpha/beta hydrolase [Candidatus Acidoferrum sp.]|nr:alpha/beta hydrolase [Candidatus Acidoferrum sp.]
MPWLRKVVLTIVGLLTIAAITGAGYQQIGSMMDARRTPEPGHLVNAGGRQFQMNCAGKGSPTVILESGLGDTLAEWQPTLEQIAKFTRVCSYDRAGYGESDAGPLPRTSGQISAELHGLLESAGEHAPFVLVGHSFGGYNARVFNGQYPNEVAGLVLVDSVQEDQYELLPSAWKQFGANQLSRWQSQATWMPLQIDFGIARLRFREVLGPDSYLILQAKYLKARASELEQIQVSAGQARAAGTIGNKPLIVLTGVKQDDALKKALSTEDFVRYQQVWVGTLQARLAQLSTRGKQEILADVGHNIPAERPEAIVNAVREVCAATAR